MEKSTSKVEVVPVKLELHPNADRLAIVRVFSGYTVCVPKEDWKDGDLGAYIPPDSIIDSSRPEFAFLLGHERIKVKKLRGIVSMGLLVKAPPGAKIGDNVADYFNVKHYDPPESLTSGGEDEKAPAGFHPNYDLDSMRRYAHLFVPGEPVYITEKLHGSSSRFCYSGGRMYAGSRTAWKRYDKNNQWWKCLEQYPEVIDFCTKNPEITVYGETYGWIQNLKYGAKPGEVKLGVFDLLYKSEWINPLRALNLAPELPWVPLISKDYPFDLNAILELAEGNSLIPGSNHIREGIVVKPLIERTDPEVGRVCLKIVGSDYLEKA